MFRRTCLAGLVLFVSAAVAAASPHEAHVALRDGKLTMADLSATLLEELHLPATSHLPPGEIDLRSFSGTLFVQAMNKSLGDGCRMSVSGDELVLHVDPDRLPHDLDSAKLALRVFTATAAPEATAAQARHYGLHLPKTVDPNRPMVILIHGLDMDDLEWQPMSELLTRAGYQVAYFGYPDDQPIADDAALLAQHLAAVHETFPLLPLNVITFSMGSLVARGYIEGPTYTGGIGHLIMIAPPNHGSSWARYRILGEWKEHIYLATHDKDWSATWMITDGLGEAGRDLVPDSTFLRELNNQLRRAGVQYTIVQGDEHPVRRYSADLVQGAQILIPQRVAGWWGFRQCRSELGTWATSIRAKTDKSDGPVTLASAALPGVSDIVVVHADHATIYRSDDDGQPPPAWEVVKDRLARRSGQTREDYPRISANRR
jgi:pimeloyl-ACP methyl ester carboxylesterase